MSSTPAPRDVNFIPTVLFEIDGEAGEVMPGQINQSTGRILVDSIGGGSAALQTDVFTATNEQTAFIATLNVATTIYFSIGGVIATPTTDYTVSAGVATLTSGSYPNGVPSGTKVIWTYFTS
jgi:hypothetical protein